MDGLVSKMFPSFAFSPPLTSAVPSTPDDGIINLEM